MSAPAGAIEKAPIPARPAILIVEDELILAKDLQHTLTDFGYDAFAIASTAEAAMRRADERCPDLVIMDVRIRGGVDGIETARLLKSRFPLAIVYLTAHADKAMIERAKETEPHGYLLKPVNVVELRSTLELALSKHQLEQARARNLRLEREQQAALSDLRRATHENDESFRMMIEAVTDYAIFMLDVEGRIASWNEGAERLKGYRKDEVLGRHLSLFYTPDDVASHKPDQHLAVAGRLGRVEDQGWRVRKDGTQFFADTFISAVYGANGQVRGFAKVTRDLTARRDYEDSLRQATLEAERANGAKSVFLANMSHEIRTPMNAVTGLTYLLEQTTLSSEQAELVGQISFATKSLLSVITDVLDLSKIEAGEMLISRVVFSPRELMKRLHAIMRVQAELKGITLGLELADALPAALRGDAVRLNQIVTNLLSNAIKFTERGGVSLCVDLLGSTSEDCTLSFRVRDTGIGIDQAAQARLFAPFVQADESITRRYGGTGLGLSIINSLTKLMGGTVDFTSTVGVGSEFHVVLRFSSATAESLTDKEPAVARGERPLAGVRVLVVDDYELNLVVTRRILELAGALVWVASTGKDALEQIRCGIDHLDVVLMDVQMPVMDGYEAARQIRVDPALRDLPVIALTAGALSSERQRAVAAGMNDFIIKPFDAATLISSVMHHVSPGRARAEALPAEPRTPMERVAWPVIDGVAMQETRRRLCDDLPLFRSLLRRFFADFGRVTDGSSRRPSPSLAEQAACMHKLKGAAGILGAGAIQRVAAELEAACTAGDAGRAAQVASELAGQLDALRSSATLAFEGGEFAEPPMQPRNEIGRPAGESRCGVLLVDDDDLVRAYVGNLLQRSGYRVGEAASGEEALRALRCADYQIVITDWNMPGMSGLELCRELRQGAENRDLYVMMFSMSERQQDSQVCRAAGADVCVPKGASNEQIIALLDGARDLARAGQPSTLA